MLNLRDSKSKLKSIQYMDKDNINASKCPRHNLGEINNRNFVINDDTQQIYYLSNGPNVINYE